MKRVTIVLVVVAVVFTVIPALAQYTDVQTAWPYGAVVWIAGMPGDAAAVTAEFATAAKEVFSLWGLPVPSPGTCWSGSVQTGSRTNDDCTQIASYEYIPPSDSSVYAAFSPRWEGEQIRPVILDFYPDPESMHVALDDFLLAGFFLLPPEPAQKKASSHVTLTTLPPLPPPGFFSVYHDRGYDLIIIAREPHWQRTLRHELAHWAFSMWCQRHGLDMRSFPKVVLEGFAEYTAHTLSGDPDRWKRIAAVWAQHGRLADTPPALAYDVGTSLVAYLVARDGKQGFLAELPQLAVDWNAQAEALTPGWRKWLSEVKPSAADRAMYEAKLERLYQCYLMLKPVLPAGVEDLVHRVDTGNGTMDDIDQFWHIIRTGLNKPRIDGWNDLIHRQDTLLIVGIRDGDDSSVIERLQELELKLKDARYHWDEYRPLYVAGVIEALARWGYVPQASK